MDITMASFVSCISMIISLVAHCNGFGMESTVLTEPVATTKGPVVGKIIMTKNQTIAYSAFTGIPYAKNPSGHRRFKPPEELDSWEEPLNVVQDSPICKQIDVKTLDIVGVEDCLYLNVYTPQTDFPGDGSYPVMLWIHGGTFSNGDSSIALFRPDSMVEEGVILVTFNYRIGAFGFLNLHLDDAAGNAGLKDQNLVLKWIQKNIGYFGGDAKRVTIVGDTAGAVSVGLHLISEMSAGLFQQSISMSGSPLCLYWGFQKSVEAEFYARELGRKLGILTSSKAELLEKLLKTDANEIVRKSKDLLSDLPFRPTLELTDVAKGHEKFMTECAFKRLRQGKYLKGPHITGFALSDAASFSERNSINMNNFLKAVILENNLYLEGSDSLIMDDGPKSLTTLATDILFAFGIDESERLIRAENDDYPVYYYRYSEDPMHVIDKFGNHTAPIYYYGYTVDSKHSATMSDDVVLGADMSGASKLSNGPFQEDTSQQASTSVTRRRLIRMWANFIKTGNPTPVGDEDELLGVEWPPVDADGMYLDINHELKVYHGRPVSGLVETLHMHNVTAKKHDNDCVRAELLPWDTPHLKIDSRQGTESAPDPAQVAIEQFEEGFKDFSNKAVSKATELSSDFADDAKKGFAKVQSGLGQAKDYVVDEGKQALEAAKTNVLNRVDEVVYNEKEKLAEVLEDEGEKLKAKAKAKVDGATDGVASGAKKTFDAATDVTSNTFKSLWNTGFGLWRATGVGTGFIDGAKNFTDGVIDATANLTKTVVNVVANDSSTATKITAHDFIDDSVDTIEQLGKNITNVGANTATDTLKRVVDFEDGAFKKTATQLADGTIETGRDTAHSLIDTTGHLLRNSIQGYTNVTTNAIKTLEVGAVNATVEQLGKVAPKFLTENVIKPGGEAVMNVISGVDGDVRDAIGGASKNGIDAFEAKSKKKVDKIATILKSKTDKALS